MSLDSPDWFTTDPEYRIGLPEHRLVLVRVLGDGSVLVGGWQEAGG